MITTYKNSLQSRKLKKVQSFTPFSWTHVVKPNEQEVELLNEKLGLSLETINDTLDQHELPRVKKEGSNLIITLRAAVRKEKQYRTIPITLIISPQLITTITTGEASAVRDLVGQKIQIYTTQQSNFFINLSLSIVSHYQNYIAAINRDVQAKKSEITKVSKADVFALVETEEILNDFVSALAANIDVIRKILKQNYINLYENDKTLIDDLSVDAKQVLNSCKNNLRTINSIREGYSTVLSIRLNQIISVLTYITAFFTIPMVVASIYGMNIKLPLADSPWAFSILAVVTLIVTLIALAAFISFQKRS